MSKFVINVDFSSGVMQEASEIADQHGSTEAQRYMARLVEMALTGVDIDTVTVVGPCCECGQCHEGYEADEVSPCGHYHSEECQIKALPGA